MNYVYKNSTKKQKKKESLRELIRNKQKSSKINWNLTTLNSFDEIILQSQQKISKKSSNIYLKNKKKSDFNNNSKQNLNRNNLNKTQNIKKEISSENFPKLNLQAKTTQESKSNLIESDNFLFSMDEKKFKETIISQNNEINSSIKLEKKLNNPYNNQIKKSNLIVKNSFNPKLEKIISIKTSNNTQHEDNLKTGENIIKSEIIDSSHKNNVKDSTDNLKIKLNKNLKKKITKTSENIILNESSIKAKNRCLNKNSNTSSKWRANLKNEIKQNKIKKKPSTKTFDNKKSLSREIRRNYMKKWQKKNTNTLKQKSRSTSLLTTKNKIKPKNKNFTQNSPNKTNRFISSNLKLEKKDVNKNSSLLLNVNKSNDFGLTQFHESTNRILNKELSIVNKRINLLYKKNNIPIKNSKLITSNSDSNSMLIQKITNSNQNNIKKKEKILILNLKKNPQKICKKN